GLMFFHGFQSVMMSICIETHCLKWTWYLWLNFIEKFFFFREFFTLCQFKTGIHRNPTAIFVNDIRINVPTTESKHFAFKFSCLVEQFQDRDIGIVDFGVIVNTFIVCLSS